MADAAEEEPGVLAVAELDEPLAQVARAEALVVLQVLDARAEVPAGFLVPDAVALRVGVADVPEVRAVQEAAPGVPQEPVSVAERPVVLLPAPDAAALVAAEPEVPVAPEQVMGPADGRRVLDVVEPSGSAPAGPEALDAVEQQAASADELGAAAKAH